jgi:hypothetical protein
VYCLDAATNDGVEKFDIAFMGAGFDTVSFAYISFVLRFGVVFWEFLEWS